jgi:hypothetical protein
MPFWMRRLDEVPMIACEECGRELAGDPDDDPTGAAAGRPMCGECYRSREFEADVAMLDAQDGELDAQIDW